MKKNIYFYFSLIWKYFFVFSSILTLSLSMSSLLTSSLSTPLSTSSSLSSLSNGQRHRPSPNFFYFTNLLVRARLGYPEISSAPWILDATFTNGSRKVRFLLLHSMFFISSQDMHSVYQVSDLKFYITWLNSGKTGQLSKKSLILKAIAILECLHEMTVNIKAIAGPIIKSFRHHTKSYNCSWSVGWNEPFSSG